MVTEYAMEQGNEVDVKQVQLSLVRVIKLKVKIEKKPEAHLIPY